VQAAVLVGIGAVGSLDEIVLHQLLRWHHFDDRVARRPDRSPTVCSTSSAPPPCWSPGWCYWYSAGGPERAAAAAIAGSCNLYDGIVRHKLLGLCQVRAGAPTAFPVHVASSAWRCRAAGRAAPAPGSRFTCPPAGKPAGSSTEDG
jgi:hypothetical protein